MSFERPADTELLMKALHGLSAFDRIVFTYSKLLTVASPGTIKMTNPPIKTSTAQVILNHLKTVNAVNFDTGQSTEDIAEALELSRTRVQHVIAELVKRNMVKMERRGRRIKYYLAP